MWCVLAISLRFDIVCRVIEWEEAELSLRDPCLGGRISGGCLMSAGLAVNPISTYCVHAGFSKLDHSWVLSFECALLLLHRFWRMNSACPSFCSSSHLQFDFFFVRLCSPKPCREMYDGSAVLSLKQFSIYMFMREVFFWLKTLWTALSQEASEYFASQYTRSLPPESGIWNVKRVSYSSSCSRVGGIWAENLTFVSFCCFDFVSFIS